jgi:addiction module HigA family antidote
MKKKALSPGKVLEGFIQEYNLSRQQLAKDLQDIAVSTVCQILNDKRRISTLLGLKLAKYFKQADDYWINLQLQYDIAEAARDPEIIAVLKSIKPAKKAAEAPPTRGRRQKEESPIKEKSTRRSKVEKADNQVKESKSSRTKALNDDKPEKPVRATRKTSSAKKEAPVEAKALRTRRQKTEKAEEPLVHEANEDKPPKPVKPRKPRKKKDSPETELTAMTVDAPVKEDLKVILIKNGTPKAEDAVVSASEDNQTDQSDDFVLEEGEERENLENPQDYGEQLDFWIDTSVPEHEEPEPEESQ